MGLSYLRNKKRIEAIEKKKEKEEDKYGSIIITPTSKFFDLFGGVEGFFEMQEQVKGNTLEETRNNIEKNNKYNEIIAHICNEVDAADNEEFNLELEREYIKSKFLQGIF